MNINYFISAPHGGSGKFLWFFLNETVYDNTVNDWRIDKKLEAIDENNNKNYYYNYQPEFYNNILKFQQVNGYVNKSKYSTVEYILAMRETFSHYTDVDKKDLIKIRILPSNFGDYIPIAVNRIFKCGELDVSDLTVSLLDKCLLTIKQWTLDSTHHESYNNLIKPSEDFDFVLDYSTIMSIEKLSQLYCKVNNTETIPEYKISYARSYIQKHTEFFQTPFYKCLYNIAVFEYNNNLLNSSRFWSIDDLNFVNFEDFLKQNLTLENYFN